MAAQYQIRLVVEACGPMWRILTMNHQGVCDGHLQGVWEDLPNHGVFLSKESAISTLRQHIRQNALIKESVSYFDADGEQIPYIKGVTDDKA